ncbi:MAG TPA: hypothetical protein VJT80_23810, partial [Steroidobacteraceae bacterium]|nr:hypothetical protein [Steroidobacteraceae bacterium]
TSGLATGMAAGSATVTATKAADASFSQAQATYTVNVTLQPQTIAFARPGSLTLQIGATLTNLASGGAGTGAITYQSTDSSVLTVNATTGVVTGVATGTAGVTATKAADATFAQAQVSYVVHVQTTDVMRAWIGATDTQVTLPQIAVLNQFWRAPAATCATPADIVRCPNATATAPLTIDEVATLTRPAYYQLSNGASTGEATLVSSKRFSERVGHAALFFNNRYWVIAGGEPQLPASALPASHTVLSDVWSSVDGKTWKIETNAAPFGPRWFHQAVVHNGAMWVIDGAPDTATSYTDAWSSTDGVNWTKRTDQTFLPWHSTHLNVAAFNGAMWAVAGGSAYSSTDGASWQQRSASGAIGGPNAGRGYASLNVYNGSLWYIGGAPGADALPVDALNDVWKSNDGISWTQVTAQAPFARRIRHQAFVMNGRLWVFGGQVPDSAGDPAWALDAWSTTDGAQWTQESTDGLDASYLAKVIEQTGPERVTLIGGIQRGYSSHVWQTTNGLDWTARSSHAQFSPRSARGVSFNGQLWIVGGTTINSNESGGAFSNEIWRSANGIDWTRVATTGPIFSPRDGHCVVVFQNKLWVIGGWDNAPFAGGTNTTFADVWSSSDGIAWTRVTAGPGFEPRAGHAVAVFQNKLWLIGGHTDVGDESDVWTSADGLTWTGVPPGSSVFPPRSSHRVVAFNNELWLTGGGAMVGGRILGTSDVWHSADGSNWTPVAGPFQPRIRHAMEVFNSRLYVIGGVSGDDYSFGARYHDVWSSADGSNWTQDTAAAAFEPRWNPASVVHGGELWLIGGFGLSLLDDVWRSTDGKNWRVGFTHDIIVP